MRFPSVDVASSCTPGCARIIVTRWMREKRFDFVGGGVGGAEFTMGRVEAGQRLSRAPRRAFSLC